MKSKSDEDILLLNGYVCTDSAGEFRVYTDLVATGLDIICHPKPNPSLDVVYYVCGKSGNSKIFPIEDVEEAIYHSRFFSEFYNRQR